MQSTQKTCSHARSRTALVHSHPTRSRHTGHRSATPVSALSIPSVASSNSTPLSSALELVPPMIFVNASIAARARSSSSRLHRRARTRPNTSSTVPPTVPRTRIPPSLRPRASSPTSHRASRASHRASRARCRPPSCARAASRAPTRLWHPPSPTVSSHRSTPARARVDASDAAPRAPAPVVIFLLAFARSRSTRSSRHRPRAAAERHRGSLATLRERYFHRARAQVPRRRRRRRRRRERASQISPFLCAHSRREEATRARSRGRDARWRPIGKGTERRERLEAWH